MLAIGSLAKAAPTPSIRFQLKPSKKVIATTGYKAKSLVLTPETTKIEILMPDQKAPGGYVKLGNLCTDVPDAIFWLGAPTMNTDRTKKTVNAAFWGVAKTDDKEVANMELVFDRATISTSSKLNSRSTSVSIEAPCMQNSKPVDEGEELVAFVPCDDGESDGATAGLKGKGRGKEKGKKGKAKAKPDAKPPAKRKHE